MSQEQRITSVEKQKKNHARFHVYVDEQYAFSIHEDILVKFRLIKGREIDPEEIKVILSEEERNRAEQYALRYLSYRPRTVSEVKDYLRRKGFEPKDCEYVVASCLEKGYLNDEIYALQWVDERKRLKPRGKNMLRQELMQRGIDESIIESAMDNQLSQDEEREMAIKLTQKQYIGKRFENILAAKKKVIPYLQRKGFSMSLIFSVFEEIKEELIIDDRD